MAALRFPSHRRSRRYLERARAYRQAAGALASLGLPETDAPPFFMLVAHSAELALKAVIAQGRTDDEHLILLGHDLPLCLRCALAGGLDVDPCGGPIAAMISDLAMPHLAQVLRYPADLAWPLPDPPTALSALTALLNRVEATLSVRGPAAAPEAPPPAGLVRGAGVA